MPAILTPCPKLSDRVEALTYRGRRPLARDKGGAGAYLMRTLGCATEAAGPLLVRGGVWVSQVPTWAGGILEEG